MSSKAAPTMATDTVEISFCVPCFNEERNVGRALETIQTAMSIQPLTYEIVVIDDGSSDRTSDVVHAYQEAHPHLPIRLQRNPSNRGLGFSYFEGASVAKGQYYMLVNGDGDLSTETILKLVEHMGKADIINPYLMNQHERPLLRRILSRTFTQLVSLLGGYSLRYYNGPVLHRRANILEAKLKTRGFGYQAELLCHLLRKGCSIIEVPFSSTYRHHQTDAFRPTNILSVSRSLSRILLTRLSS